MITATRTLLFTDLAGYTARVGRSDREGLRRILEQHEAIVRPLVEERHGRIIKNIGDSFLCSFRSATDALRAALRILEAGHDGETPSIRLAVATGDVEEIDGDAFGRPVNLASRILGIAPAGECWFSLGTRICMTSAEVPWESVGWYRLKGIETEQECFRAVPEHRTWLPEPLATAAREGRLVRLRPGAPTPKLPLHPVLLLEGYRPGTPELQATLDRLPVLDPASFYLGAYVIPSGDRQAWTAEGHGLVIGSPEAIDAAVQALERPTEPEGLANVDDSSTMLLDLGNRVILQLVEGGLALPAVPFAEILTGYSYDLLPDGQWVSQSDHAVLRILVEPRGVYLLALTQGIAVNGALPPSGRPVPLHGDELITGAFGQMTFYALSGPYEGLLSGDTDVRLGVGMGQRAELGRRPEAPGLAYPGRDGQTNISWASGPRAARARANNFTLDRVLTGRHQAAITPGARRIRLEPLHPDCPTYLFRDGDLQHVTDPTDARFGDLVVAGTHVVALRPPD